MNVWDKIFIVASFILWVGVTNKIVPKEASQEVESIFQLFSIILCVYMVLLGFLIILQVI